MCIFVAVAVAVAEAAVAVAAVATVAVAVAVAEVIHLFSHKNSIVYNCSEVRYNYNNTVV